MNQKYLLHYSNDTGSVEYFVVADDYKPETIDDHAREGVTCDNVVVIEELLLRKFPAGLRSNLDILPAGYRMVKTLR